MVGVRVAIEKGTRQLVGITHHAWMYSSDTPEGLGWWTRGRPTCVCCSIGSASVWL